MRARECEIAVLEKSLWNLRFMSKEDFPSLMPPFVLNIALLCPWLCKCRA